MPQFLRAIRMLCSLYKHYVEALKTETQTTRQSPTTLSTPSSPSPHFAAGSHSPSGASVRRAGSFGSILDSPDLSHGGHGRGSGGGGGGGGRLGRRFGHRRSHSQSTNPDNSPTTTRENRSQTLAVSLASPTTPQRTGSGNSHRGNDRKHSREASISISDPFEQLETVWNSLESWFDLLMTEVAKLQATENTSAQATIISMNGEDKSAQKQETEPRVRVQTPEELSKKPSESEQPTRKPQLALPTVQSSRLAAAIVKSAPIDRRAAFLRPSSSFDHSSPSMSSEPSGPVVMDKRRSWHMEQLFTIRYLASGGSLSSIPSFQRSLSSEINLGEC